MPWNIKYIILCTSKGIALILARCTVKSIHTVQYIIMHFMNSYIYLQFYTHAYTVKKASVNMTGSFVVSAADEWYT